MHICLKKELSEILKHNLFGIWRSSAKNVFLNQAYIGFFGHSAFTALDCLSVN